MTTSGGWRKRVGGRMEQKGERPRGLGQQCGDCWGEKGIWRLNGNGKKIQ